MSKRIYISGKISGLDLRVAQELFEQAALLLKEHGYIPVNPMELCPVNEAFTWKDYMKFDIKILCDCDGIYMLENWKESKGG